MNGKGLAIVAIVIAQVAGLSLSHNDANASHLIVFGGAALIGSILRGKRWWGLKP